MVSFFLNQAEISMIRRDFIDYLNSPECITIKLKWIADHTGVYDKDYRIWLNDMPVYNEETIRAGFQDITSVSVRKYGWGDDLIGGAVLLFDSAKDLSGKPGLTFEQQTDGGIINWAPVIPQPTIPEGLRVPLGTTQMAQVVACRRGLGTQAFIDGGSVLFGTQMVMIPEEAAEVADGKRTNFHLSSGNQYIPNMITSFWNGQLVGDFTQDEDRLGVTFTEPPPPGIVQFQYWKAS